MHRRVAPVVAVALLPLALAACSSGGGTNPTSSPTSSSASPTDTSSPTDTASPTDSPTDTSSPSPTGSPSTVSPSPIVGIDSISVVYGPTTVPADTKVLIVGTTVTSLSGKPAYIIKLNDGAPRVIATGSSVNAKGEIKTYAQLLRTGVLQLVVPRTPLTLGAADSPGSYPWDPNTPVLAKSAEFTITVTK
jgi:hypothetical protein